MLHDGKGSEILLALLPHCTPRKKVGEITTTQSSQHNFSRQEKGKWKILLNERNMNTFRV
jgi:hypothetical protein